MLRRRGVLSRMRPPDAAEVSPPNRAAKAEAPAAAVSTQAPAPAKTPFVLRRKDCSDVKELSARLQLLGIQVKMHDWLLCCMPGCLGLNGVHGLVWLPSEICLPQLVLPF